ncbi:MAG: DNA repair protein RecO [Gammaproteobacteria bacterium]|nr:DNA repair protein RecO [Gammaproteobacteria bacterium]MYC24816.1 DNA repair protein RecO [Gammaproteobacteria bacterium]
MIASGTKDRGVLLHRRPYSDSRTIVELLTASHGRVSGVLRQSASAASRAELFVKYELSWRGRNELVNVSHCEPVDTYRLSGRGLFSGLYLNELVMRTTRSKQLVSGLFDRYLSALYALQDNEDLEPPLRSFERGLLESLGLAVQFDREMPQGNPIDPKQSYQFRPQQGFQRLPNNATGGMKGSSLLAVAKDDYSTSASRQAAKLVLRTALQDFIGEQPLVSRALFQSFV